MRLLKSIVIDTSHLISLIKQGKEQGLNALYDAYSDALYGIVFRILRKQEESEEVVQSVFMKIWQHISSFDETKSTIFTWMAAIAKNSAIDMRRSKGFKHEQFTDSLSFSDFGLQTSSKPKMLDIEKLTAKMPEKYKLLLDKMFLEGYTQQEIADHYNIPLGTVKTRLRESINILREDLKSERHLLYFLTFMA